MLTFHANTAHGASGPVSFRGAAPTAPFPLLGGGKRGCQAGRRVCPSSTQAPGAPKSVSRTAQVFLIPAALVLSLL